MQIMNFLLEKGIVPVAENDITVENCSLFSLLLGLHGYLLGYTDLVFIM